MLTREEFLKNKILEHGSMKDFAKQINMPYTTLFSILKNVGGASIDNVLKICAGLNINADDLENINNSPVLTSKDERDIQKRLQSILNDLNSDAALSFYNGDQEMDDETKELLKVSLEQSIRTAKIRAKEKFTPNKYKK